ncbi:MAG: hypothetical protein IPL97_00860 [Niastella sp.]|nr:hypothetical protein [Niastella sp.]
MKPASLKDIKTEIELMPAKELTSLIMRLAKFKKENKELITYLLFEAQDETGYINSVKEEIDLLFTQVNVTNIYFAKKTIRKIIRYAGRYIKYAASSAVEIEIEIAVCNGIKKLPIDISRSTALQNLYNAQLKKIHKALDSLHEDLQFEYKDAVSQL